MPLLRLVNRGHQAFLLHPLYIGHRVFDIAVHIVEGHETIGGIPGHRPNLIGVHAKISCVRTVKRHFEHPDHLFLLPVNNHKSVHAICKQVSFIQISNARDVLGVEGDPYLSYVPFGGVDAVNTFGEEAYPYRILPVIIIQALDILEMGIPRNSLLER